MGGREVAGELGSRWFVEEELMAAAATELGFELGENGYEDKTIALRISHELKCEFFFQK